MPPIVRVSKKTISPRVRIAWLKRMLERDVLRHLREEADILARADQLRLVCALQNICADDVLPADIIRLSYKGKSSRAKK